MNKNINQKRTRNRGSSGRRGPSRNQLLESNGPEVKVRGTAQQILDKYLQHARDAQSSGDRIKAEGLLQYAEHYYRVLGAEAQNANPGDNNSPSYPSGNEAERPAPVENRQDDAQPNLASIPPSIEPSPEPNEPPRQRRPGGRGKPNPSGSKPNGKNGIAPA